MLVRYFENNYKKEDALRYARDFYQVLILNEIFGSKFRDSLVLRGLTAARLAYDVGEGNDKLELTSIKKPFTKEFSLLIEKITKKYPDLKFIKSVDKRYIFVVEILVQDSEEISIFIELSKLKFKIKKGVNFDLKKIEMKKWNIETLGNVTLMSELISKHKELKV